MISLPHAALFLLLPAAALAGDSRPQTPLSRSPHDVALPAANAKPAPPAVALPPLPDGVQELKFADFFKLPVGPEGLELAPKMAGLDGRRVRVLGYMVLEKIDTDEGDAHQDSGTPPTVPGRLILAATPQVVNVAHYGFCEDLPPQTLFVTVPGSPEKPLPYTAGLLLLTGTLHLGAHLEADGRTSLVRLALDPQELPSKPNPANHLLTP